MCLMIYYGLPDLNVMCVVFYGYFLNYWYYFQVHNQYLVRIFTCGYYHHHHHLHHCGLDLYDDEA